MCILYLYEALYTSVLKIYLFTHKGALSLTVVEKDKVFEVDGSGSV